MLLAPIRIPETRDAPVETTEMKIGLIADTHNYFDPAIREYFSDCDEIWHVGDFGTMKVIDELRKIAPLRGVYGNIDGQDIRKEFPKELRFEVEGMDVYMTHIGGNPGRYAIPVREMMESDPPDLFITGHSHILKIARDPNNRNILFINPGAAGKHGFQVERTLVRFSLNDGKISDMEVINLGNRA